MTGSVRKRGNTWSYIIPIGKYENGRTKYKWVGGFLSEEEADEERILALRKQRGQDEKTIENSIGNLDFQKMFYYMMSCMLGQNRDYDIQNPSSTITVAEYLRDWFEIAKMDLRSCSEYSYSNDIEKHIIPQIGKFQLRELHPSHIQNMYDGLRKQGLSSTTVLHIHRVLKKALRKAVGVYININPIDRVEDIPKRADYEAHPLTGEQTKKLLIAAKKTPIFIAILLAVCLGLRRGEILGLKWNRIDFDNKKILVDNIIVYKPGEVYEGPPKSKKGKRTLKISNGLVDILKAMKVDVGALDDGYVLSRKEGKPFSASTLYVHYKKLLRSVNISTDTRIHDLRHTNATLQIKEGISMKVVSQRLGHSSIVITMDLYGHVLDDMQDAAAAVMDDYFI